MMMYSIKDTLWTVSRTHTLIHITHLYKICVNVIT